MSVPARLCGALPGWLAPTPRGTGGFARTAAITTAPVAATATGASLMPPVGEADFGMLEAGKSADLIVLDADPLTDIRNTLEIDQVMQRGEWVERDGLLAMP